MNILNTRNNLNKPKATVECLKCGHSFKTTLYKNAGDKFQCHDCGHSMRADIDWGEDGQIVWFAVTDKDTKKNRAI
ncbi:hypothetical protein BC355_08905 [Vibrio cholerae]|uniref:Uncharacterized protein n=1 Tax=Vibrio cholerae TaxID=666 RepID=A0A395U2M9_VIBCL|nr:hypothetical protein [Vibrio cholerae]RGP89829.1 hypothetical protein BC353_09715 [Vibrio cholerae]RGP90013.1 hypothetical protein BC355_08905 [Vibrio cholerae]RGP90736.1 hypothetical protein BC354_08100 [Vibrio cholerae]HAS2628643.1 hypothetical protein [Vibrio cholerae]HAS4509426.1 hypothetical protein [Vibrio cholerae]